MSALGRLARTPLAAPLRALANHAVGSQPRVVKIRGGLARGLRAELDLRNEKAFWLGHYEPHVQAFLRANVRPGDVVYDVGANVGFFSLCAAQLGGRVYAFEVAAGNVARLERNVGASGLPIEVVEAAVWEEDGTVDFVSGENASEGHVLPGFGVRAIALDSFARDNEPPTVLKIDVEGAELHVLRGAQEVLATSVRALTCELHAGVDRDAVLALLAAFAVDVSDDGTRIMALRGA